MDKEAAKRHVAEAQEAYNTGVRDLRLRRQQAVMTALDAGLTKYAIAAAMGVKGPTVDSIIQTAIENQS